MAETLKPFNLSEFGGAHPAFDLNEFAPKPPRGAPAEIATAFGRGAFVDLPTLAGQALQYTGDKGDTLHDIGEGWVKSAKERGDYDFLQLHPEAHGTVVNALASGVQMAPSALGAIGIGALGAAAAPEVAGASALGGALGLVAGATPFALQAGQETLEKGRAKGLSESDALTAARLNAGQTLATQTALGHFGGKLLGLFGSKIGSAVGQEGSALAEKTMAQLTGSDAVLVPFAKQLGQSAAAGVGLGATQAGVAAGIENAYGIDNVSPLHAMKESIGPMLGLTAVMSPLGLAGRARSAKAAAETTAALASHETHPELRDQLATQYFERLNQVDPESAKQFAYNADTAIQNKLPLPVDSKLFTADTITVPKVEEPAPPPEPVLGLPAPAATSPFTVFPDNTVGTREDVEKYISGLPDNEQVAARARLYGIKTEEHVYPTIEEPVTAPLPEMSDVPMKAREITPASETPVSDRTNTQLADALREAKQKKGKTDTELAFEQKQTEDAAAKDRDLEAIYNISKGREQAEAAARGEIVPDVNAPMSHDDLLQNWKDAGTANGIETKAQASAPFMKRLESLGIGEKDTFAEQRQALMEVRDDNKNGMSDSQRDRLSMLIDHLDKEHGPIPETKASIPETELPKTESVPNETETQGAGVDISPIRAEAQTAADKLDATVVDFHDRIRKGEKLSDLEQERFEDATGYRKTLQEAIAGNKDEAYIKDITGYANETAAPYKQSYREGGSSDYVPPANADATSPLLRRALGRIDNVPDMLSFLKGAGSEPWVKDLATRLQSLDLGTTLQHMPDQPFKNGALGTMLWNPDHIVIGKGGESEHVVMHEILHAATVARIEQARQITIARTQNEFRLKQSYNELDGLRQDAINAGLDTPERLKDVHEFVAELHTNKEFQEKLKDLPAPKNKPGIWERIKSAFNRLLGQEDTEASRTALDHALDISGDFLSNERYKASDATERSSNFETSPKAAVQETDNTLSKVGEWANKLAPGAMAKFGEVAHQQVLAWSSWGHIKQVYKDVLPNLWGEGQVSPLDMHVNAQDTAGARIQQRIHEVSGIANKMAGLDGKMQDATYRLMGESTDKGIFPNRPFEEQPWLKPSDRRDYNRLKQIYDQPGVKDVYDSALQHNRDDYDQSHAAIMRNQGRLDNAPEELWKNIDPTEGYSPKVKALEDWIKTNGDQEARDSLAGVMEFHQKIQTGPYFHLGRYGDYFHSFHIADTPQARAAVQQVLKMSGLSDRSVVGEDAMKVTSRFERVGEWKALVPQLEKLASMGAIEQVTGGRVDKNLAQLDSTAPSFVRSLMNKIDNDARMDDTQRTQSKELLRRMYMEMLPETSASKAFARRAQNGAIPGYDVDMRRSFVKRATASAYFMAHNAAQPELAIANQRFGEGIKDLRQTDPERSVKASLVYEEMRQRQANALTPLNTPALDALGAMGHSFYLASNPAFIISNLAQPLQFSMPILGAKHGFVASAGALSKASGLSWGIIKDTLGEGWKDGGWRGILDANISIDRSKATAPEKEFLKAAVASGQVEWTQPHEMGRIAEGGNENIGTAVKLGGVLSHYGEAINRMTTGLAAFNLEMKRNGGDQVKATDYALQTIKNTQFDNSPQNKARMLGKQGAFGQATPLVTQFMQFSIQTMELLSRLGIQAVKNDTPGARAEAVKAMGGIMATSTLLAGSLGLPFAGVIAAAYNAIMGDEDHPADFMSDHRNWLSDTFGKDVGETISNGVLNKVTGADIGSHLSLANILPMTQFLADRRKIKDKLDAGAVSMLGPTAAAGINIADGVHDMSNGYVMQGLVKMVPAVLKGPTKAIDQSINGFHDAHGNKLPIDANSWDTFTQSLNFTPDKLADQRQAQRSFGTTKALLQERSQTLTEQFARAVEEQDNERAKQITDKIAAFNTANPDMAIRDLGGALRQRAISRALAQTTGIMNVGKKQVGRAQNQNRSAGIGGTQ